MDDVMRKLLTRTDVHKQLGAVFPGTVEFIVPILHDGKIAQIGVVSATDPDQGAGTYTCQIDNATQDLSLTPGGTPVDLHAIGAGVMHDVALDPLNLVVTEGDAIKFTIVVTDRHAKGGDDLQAVIEYHKAMSE